MDVRVRFAPSPTGHVHIGNIRAAIFNWLFARHAGGHFLLRVEDTDRERSTPEAIATLLDVMRWLELDVDEAPLYQSTQVSAHLAAAARLVAAGSAYRSAKGGAGEAVLFRIPWDAPSGEWVVDAGPVEVDIHSDVPLAIDAEGLRFAGISSKGKPMPQAACLAGFHGLEVLDATGTCLYRLADDIGDILAGRREACVEHAARLRFNRRLVQYEDVVKGLLAKPLDSLRDFVILRSDDTPVFHLANVCDDITQGITHIIRGDDHVENTFRHIFLFAALGAPPPRYAHLPMIVNAQGKPYSKRDGDAFVGDFRAKGFLPEALFNYLTLLGWSPGDDREKLDRAELVRLFSLDRVQSAAAQMDLNKLLNLNGHYLADLPAAEFAERARAAAADCAWAAGVDDTAFAAVAALMQSRTKLITQVEGWATFFVEMPEYDEAACRKFLTRPGTGPALERIRDNLRTAEFTPEGIEAAIHAATATAGIEAGRLNQPLRIAITGTTVGAGIYETAALIGRERVLRRLGHCLDTWASEPAGCGGGT